MTLYELDNDEYFKAYYDAMHQEYYIIQDETPDPIVFTEKYEVDKMYYCQDMKQPDRTQFR